MANSLADRIESRLKALGKNPSSVALEAGLGRSSVRDIIANGANPRIDTLRKLTGPLACSLDYLTGVTNDAGDGAFAGEPVEFLDIEPQTVDSVTVLESGVFRRFGADEENPAWRHQIERQIIYGDVRFPGWDTVLYMVGDDSLRHANILRGDFLTVARTKKVPVPLRPGSLVVAYFILAGTTKLAEYSARFVELIDGDIVLKNASPDPQFAEIRLADPIPSIDEWEKAKAEDGRPSWYAVDGGILIVDGVVVRMTRPLTGPSPPNV
ncbi:transcriptional regulator with XRE-family HTH domain [Nitrobacteraceae bacterium AZCC 2161]